VDREVGEIGAPALVLARFDEVDAPVGEHVGEVGAVGAAVALEAGQAPVVDGDVEALLLGGGAQVPLAEHAGAVPGGCELRQREE
jgi:hypothetical protein